MNIIAAINWSPSPEIFHLGLLTVRILTLAIAATFILAYIVLNNFMPVSAKRNKLLNILPYLMVLGVIAIYFLDNSGEVFSIGPLSVRWYSLLFALGFVLGYIILSWIFKTEHQSEKNLESLTIYLIIGAVVGARLGHCLFYEPDYYLAQPIRILEIWKGGLASHGAAVGITLAVLLFVKNHKNVNFFWLADRVVIIVALAACFVRIGNFINSEIVGKPANLPWAIVFLNNGDKIPRHPTQIYEALTYLALFIYLFFTYKKYKENLPKGLLVGVMLTTMFTMRFLLEFLKENQVGFESTLPINMGQFLSLPFIALGIYFIIRSRQLSSGAPKAPGTT